MSTTSESMLPSSDITNNHTTTNGSDNENDTSTVDIKPTVAIEEQSDNLPEGTTINPVDEDSQFIFDEETSRLLCIGSNFDDIPRSIVDAYGTKSKILDLSKNRFRSLGCIKNFPNLEELILDDNDLDDTYTRFPKLSKLHTLMLNKNRIQDIYKLIDQLRYAYPMLTYLSLLGNEACPYRILSSQTSSSNDEASPFAQNRLDEEYQRYRHLLIFRIPTLKFLDAREISANERHVATRLGDILNSIAETKNSKTTTTTANDETQNERKFQYTPLPSDIDKNKRKTSVGKIRHPYHGDGSQGNKFVKDGDL